MSSRITISHLLPSAENSANNAFNYNGNNGKLNNNNKNNTNSCRPFLELGLTQSEREAAPFSLAEIYDIYRKTRENKTTKPSHLLFELDYPCQLQLLWAEINGCYYKPRTSIAFVITKPKTREVIAADFRDRIAQTLLVQEMLPHLEKYEHPHSYSCRVGRGCLAAALHLSELSKKYMGGYVFQLDIANHFMSIDTDLWTPRVLDFIDKHYEDKSRAEVLKYLANTIYHHRPQDDCVRKSPMYMWNDIPPRKSLFHSETGVPIGNVTSQTLSNFVTTGYLRLLDEMGFEFAFYTDDTGGFTFDKDKLLSYIPIMRNYLRRECGLELHKDKVYIQEANKGFNALGFRFRGNNIMPSKRIVHNFHRLIAYLEEIEADARNLYLYRDRAMARVNSFLGLLRWSHSYNIRKAAMERLKATRWAQIFFFDKDCRKVTIKPSKSLRTHYIRLNKIRRNEYEYARAN